MRAVVADALPVMGVALVDVLERRGYRPVARVGTAADLAMVVRRLAPALVFVDLSLPCVATAVEEVCNDSCAPVVVLVGDREQDELVLAGVLAGAVGAVGPDITSEALWRALAAVEAGESLIPRSLVPRVLAELRLRAELSVAGPSPHMSGLTGRERQVLEMMRAGLTTAEIAQRLVVEPVTVRTHICAIRRKLRPAVGPSNVALPLLTG